MCQNLIVVLVGYKMILTNLTPRALLVVYHLVSVQQALVE